MPPPKLREMMNKDTPEGVDVRQSWPAFAVWGVHTTTVSAMQQQIEEHQRALVRQDGEIRGIDKTTTVALFAACSAL